MHFTWRQFGLIAVAMVMMGGQVRAQVSIGQNTEVNLSGDGFFGWNEVMSDIPSVDSFSTNSSNVGGSLNLWGHYYHPNFLSFQVRPYYNQTRLNSNFNSIFGAKGINASANLFSGSSIPGTIDFERSYNSEEQLNLPGAPGFVTKGSSTSLNIGWGFLFKRMPSVHVNFGLNSNNADILGTEEQTSGHSRVFGIGAGYSVAGFNLNGTFTNRVTNLNVPDLSDLTHSEKSKTHENTLLFTASRKLFSWANFTSTLNHTHFTTDFLGAPTDQTYNTLNTNVAMRPTQNLDINAGINYTSNLSAILVGSVLPVSGSVTTAPSTSHTNEFASDIQDYTVRTTYRLTKDLTVTGGVDRINEHFQGIDVTGNSLSATVGYSHSFLGGQFGAYYGFGRYSSDLVLARGSTSSLAQDSPATTNQLGGVSYSHSFQLLGWRGDGRGQYARNTQSVLIGQTSTTLGGSTSLSRDFGEWSMTLNASVSKARTSGLVTADSFSDNFGVSVSRRRFGFGGNYGRSYGDSLSLTNASNPSIPPTGALIPPNLLVEYHAQSYGVNGSYTPNRRLRIFGTYIHSLISTGGGTALSNSILARYDVRVQYTYRQLNFTGGVSHISQGVGTTFDNPAKVNAFYFGISRHFDFF